VLSFYWTPGTSASYEFKCEEDRSVSVFAAIDIYGTVTTIKKSLAGPSLSIPDCPICGKPETWIPQYQRWYCYNCKKYL
jgi:hypothetical protein